MPLSVDSEDHLATIMLHESLLISGSAGSIWGLPQDMRKRGNCDAGVLTMDANTYAGAWHGDGDDCEAAVTPHLNSNVRVCAERWTRKRQRDDGLYSNAPGLPRQQAAIKCASGNCCATHAMRSCRAIPNSQPAAAADLEANDETALEIDESFL